ncbi:F1F0 ATP synthase assembly protein-like protein Atp11 [Trichodelitschia bisporula]|uniref:F1F0 ATP synthase assembly protein-like protein Atp11 n=1 Tax=Trichodelitschia bisporula TaxID=703511 RepID=A0A6G1IBD7_9PEZI|nr:F1F0 ATP synthase assembly protein-like protein Atp11 [Trichodelitschia bisporula]
MPPFRPFARRLFAPLRQRRYACVQNVRFLRTGNEQQIIERYKEKLESKAREAGLKDINDLKEVYKEKIETLRKEAVVPGANAPLNPPSQHQQHQQHQQQQQQQHHQPATPAPFTPPPPPTPKPSIQPGVKTLSSFLDIPKLAPLSPKEIEALWRLRHASNPRSLCATIPATTYAHMALLASKHPQFVLPLPREGAGAEMHFLQWTFPAPHTATILLTHLAEYKLRGEYASPHTTVTMHGELAAEKDVVLAQGTVTEKSNVSVEEGRWLLVCLQRFYGGSRDGVRLLERFSAGDEAFRIEDVLEEAERLP